MSGAVARARVLLSKRGGWIDSLDGDGAYRLRLGTDRRSRVVLTIDETHFRALVKEPGLRARPGGGWIARPELPAVPRPPIGSPGRIEGERWLMEPDGRTVARRANLGESPIAWLARRTDASGRPWLAPAEVAAGERLRADAEMAQSGPSMTMRWDALPRSTGRGSAARVEPGDRALTAGRRVAEALAACEPAARSFVEHICVRGRTLQLAEQDLGLRRREGKAVLRRGLAALARHYGIG